MTVVPFGDYLPDQPALANPGLLKATNVVPKATSYGPLKSLTAFSDAISARARGAGAFRQRNGTVFNFCGDATKLYKLSNAAWGDVSRSSGGAYSVGTDDSWDFVNFGNNVIASNGSDAVQKFEMGADSEFSALSGSPPTYRYGAIVREFLVVGSVGASNKTRFQWCDQNDVTEWSAGQAGSKDIPTGGDVQGITGGEYGLIFQERQISRLDYVGPPTVWQLDVIEENRGALAPGSIAKHGSLVFFLSDDGFYVCDGTQAYPIGDEKFDKTFFADLDENYRYRVTATIDPINKLYVLAYPGVGNNAGATNKLAIYNYERKRWSTAEVDTDMVYAALSEGVSLDALGSLYSSLDSLPFSLDSRVWQGNSLILSAFNSDHKGAHFNGSALEAVFETGEQQLTPGRRSLVTNTRPLVEADATVRVGSRIRQRDSVSYTSSSSMNDEGENPVLSDSRFHRFEVTIPAGEDWSHAQGIDVTFEDAGEY